MAGTVVADTIQDGAGNSTAMDNAIYGSAKAWVNFAGSTATIRASYNTSSITRVTTGQFTMNLTNALADANFCITGTAGSGNVYGDYGIANRGQGSNTSSTVTFNTFITHATTLVDCDLITVAVFR